MASTMIIRVSHPSRIIRTTIQLPASKSISNRVLLIQALSAERSILTNLSKANDTLVLKKLLATQDSLWNAEDAGTTFRFLIAFACLLNKEIIITGTDRMKQRPVGELVDALNSIGARMIYMEKEGFPPVKIFPAIPLGGKVRMTGSISSQFVSALLLIAPCLKKGLDLSLTGEVVSEPYILMTLGLMNLFGVSSVYNDNHIRIKPQVYQSISYACEPDWTAASYWFEMAALSEAAEIMLLGISGKSLQGDVIIADLMKDFGVVSKEMNGSLLVKKKEAKNPDFFKYNFKHCPDLAQTIACTLAGINGAGDLQGLQSLRIKETNRAEALQRELYNLSVQTDFCDGSKLKIYNNRPIRSTGRILKTHADHRMAMSLAPLSLKLPFIDIEDPDVISKSYPNYWEDLKKAGFIIEDLPK